MSEIDPQHYKSHPSGVEAIQITEHMNFNLGNVIKYVWRAGLKSANPLTDLEKAKWYLEREIARIKQSIADKPAVDGTVAAQYESYKSAIARSKPASVDPWPWDRENATSKNREFLGVI